MNAFWNRHKLIKPKPYRSLQYMAWVRTWPCMICGTYENVQAMHTGPHGRGTKSSDFRTLPGCPEHHLGTDGLDVLGPERFETKYNIDLKQTVLLMIEIYLSEGNTL